jgi:hypothetical protein
MVISTPDAGADTPEVSMDVRILMTDCAVSDVQGVHVLRKQLGATTAGLHASKKFAGKFSRPMHPFQAA